MRIKVAHLITRLDLGGAQQNTLHTVAHLDRSEFEPSLLCGPGGFLDEEAKTISRDAERPFQIHFFPDLRREVAPLRDLSALLRLTAHLLRHRPHLVHTHSSKAGILGRLAAFLARVPRVVHTYHGFGFHSRQNPLLRLFYVSLERLCVRLSDWTVFVSEENRRAAQGLGLAPAERHSIIRSGVDLKAYPAPLEDKGRKKASLGCGMHKPLVVSVGNLKPQKNPEAFLRMAAACLKEMPESRFLFVGDGELRSKLEVQVIARGLHGKVLFPGWRRDGAEILASADVFVLTSLWEGLPRALVEAMKTGLACACYATDGIKDLVRDGENGLLIMPNDEAELARKVLLLLRDEGLRRRLGESAARSIGPEFDIDGMVREQEKLYRRLLGVDR